MAGIVAKVLKSLTTKDTKVNEGKETKTGKAGLNTTLGLPADGEL
jgi:hypothetical protein